MEKFVEELKEKYPKTWSKFKDYLRDNYEFWTNETNENTLWFCERDPQAQIGYFLHWMNITNYFHINLKLEEDENNIFETHDIISTVMSAIKLTFKYLEKNEN